MHSLVYHILCSAWFHSLNFQYMEFLLMLLLQNWSNSSPYKILSFLRNTIIGTCLPFVSLKGKALQFFVLSLILEEHLEGQHKTDHLFFTTEVFFESSAVLPQPLSHQVETMKTNWKPTHYNYMQKPASLL